MRKTIIIFIPAIIILAVLLRGNNISGREYVKSDTKEQQAMNESHEKFEKATFAGGCFWCMQPPFDRLEGVIKTTVGYSGGTEKNPTYQQVASGQTSHTESVQVIFDPKIIKYEKLLEIFWMNIDPTQANGQFADKGAQYRTAIFYHDDNQKESALKSKKNLEDSGKFNKPIVTIIEPYKSFHVAEDYHQNYYEKNPIHYKMYKKGSGREGYIERTWGD